MSRTFPALIRDAGTQTTMAKNGANLNELVNTISARSAEINNRMTIRFIKGDIIYLIITNKGTGNNKIEDVEPRGTGFTPQGGTREVLKYKFSLTRSGKTFPVFITLGVFTSLPLAKRGYEITASERQRLGNNAIFSDFEMRSAEDIINNLRKGVVCDEVFTTSESQAQCYRWVIK